MNGRKKLEFLVLSLYGASIPLAETIDVGFGQRTPSFYFGFLYLIFSVVRPRFCLFPFLCSLILSFPIIIDLTGRGFSIRDSVFFFNLAIFYFLFIFFSEAPKNYCVSIIMVFVVAVLGITI